MASFQKNAMRLPKLTVVLLVVVAFVVPGCQDNASDQIADVALIKQQIESVRPPIEHPKTELALTLFCGDCHPFPNPQSFTRDRWRKEVTQGIQIYDDSGRHDLTKPDLEFTVRWFESHAPEVYDFGELAERADDEDRDERFEKVTLDNARTLPVAGVAKIRGQDDGHFLVTDMIRGEVNRVSLTGAELEHELLGEIGDACHVEPLDLDGNGELDYVVTDLGSMNPEDFYRGGVWWLVKRDQAWQRHPIKLRMSRVADVRPIDYDLDGDQDLVVAEFGFRFLGGVHLLTNQGMKDGVPQFESRVIDQRNGPTQVPVVDFNRDGKPDVITLVAQEHETIDLQLNLGNGEFKSHRLHQAGDAAYGSSGIDVVDFDGDGDLDVIYCNGDTFDDHLAKPFHRIQWLENTGEFPLVPHEIARMPGVHRAVAGDIDLDGDLDLAAVAFLSDAKVDGQSLPVFDSVVWIEHVSPSEFKTHRILIDQCDYPACDLVDLDGDSDLDLVVGPFTQNKNFERELMIFRNTTR